jgi:hypothetical protein
MVALPVPREPNSGSHSADREYLKAQNRAVRERRRRKEAGLEEEEEEEEAEEEEVDTEAEEEENSSASLTTGPSLATCHVPTSPPLLPASGIEHIDTMTSHLRGVVHENIPSEFHDLFYLFVALVGLFVMYIGVRRVARMLGLSANQGKSE